MPHKKAKFSTRQNEKKQIGNDLAPKKDSLSNEAIPKALSRVLNAATIREEYKLKKRKLEDDNARKQGDKRRKVDGESETKDFKSKRREAQATTKLVIKPGESIQHFNRRVEDDMRPLVKAAFQTSNAAVRNTYKEEKEQKLAKRTKGNAVKGDDKKAEKIAPKSSPIPQADKYAHKAKEFAQHSSSAPRRLNDIAQAPPEFKRLPRGASSQGDFGGKREGIISMAQKQMMEKERENAIARYRELKSRRHNTGDKADGQE
ncbi:hypothetical protein H0H87_005118 [Tephrocybe sp. NHM501043]|nr:hypothetical protein H0H87_005118 [Tephrocybe sp. NHM501043]